MGEQLVTPLIVKKPGPPKEREDRDDREICFCYETDVGHFRFDVAVGREADKKDVLHKFAALSHRVYLEIAEALNESSDY